MNMEILSRRLGNSPGIVISGPIAPLRAAETRSPTARTLPSEMNRNDPDRDIWRAANLLDILLDWRPVPIGV